MTIARFSARVSPDGSFRRPHITLAHVSGRRPTAAEFQRMRLPPVEMNANALPRNVSVLSAGATHIFEVRLC
jgi:hypothetical protein